MTPASICRRGTGSPGAGLSFTNDSRWGGREKRSGNDGHGGGVRKWVNRSLLLERVRSCGGSQALR